MNKRAMPRQRGFALIVVLWIAVLLALISVAVNSLSRSDVSLATNMDGALRAELAADSALETAIFALAQRQDQTWKTDGSLYYWRISRAEVRVSVTNELLRTDLNRAPLAVLQQMFVRAGFSVPDATALAQMVEQFRKDTTPIQRTTLTAEQRVRAGEYTFGLTEEISVVPGLDKAVAQRIQPFATVYSGLQQPVSKTTSGENGAAAVPVQPQAYPAPFHLDELLTVPVAYNPAADKKDTIQTTVFRIHAEALLEDGSHFSREAVITLAGSGDDQPYIKRMWRRGARVLFPRSE